MYQHLFWVNVIIPFFTIDQGGHRHDLDDFLSKTAVTGYLSCNFVQEMFYKYVEKVEYRYLEVGKKI